jgi:hypothetical protein
MLNPAIEIIPRRLYWMSDKHPISIPKVHVINIDDVIFK